MAILLALLAPSCSSEPAVETPAASATCEELVDLAAERIRNVVADLGTATVDDLEADNPDDPFEAISAPFVGFRERAAELGCLEGEVDQLTCNRLDGLESAGPVAEDFLAGYYELCG